MPAPESTPGRNVAPVDPHRAVDPQPAADASASGPQQCRDWLNWAAAQVEACVGNDGVAMHRLMESLHELIGAAGSRTAARGTTVPGTTVPGTTDGDVEARLTAVVVAVQTHDRVMQGLIHVAESMRALESQLADPRRAGSAESWRQLREKQFRAFSMAEERALFAQLVAHEADTWREAVEHPGDAVELFADDEGRGS